MFIRFQINTCWNSQTFTTTTAGDHTSGSSNKGKKTVTSKKSAAKPLFSFETYLKDVIDLVTNDTSDDSDDEASSNPTTKKRRHQRRSDKNDSSSAAEITELRAEIESLKKQMADKDAEHADDRKQFMAILKSFSERGTGGSSA